MGKYFADQHASAVSQLEGKPSGVDDSPEITALRSAKSYEEFLALGDALSYQLRFREAIDAYGLAAAMFPKRPAAYRRRAGRYLSTLQTAEAMDDLMCCCVLSGENRELSYRMGLCLYLSGEYGEAMEEFETYYSQWDDEMRIALIYWHTLSAWRADAEPVLLRDTYHKGMEVGHHTAYEVCMAAASGRTDLFDELARLTETEEDLEYSILAYGLAGCLDKRGRRSSAERIIQSSIQRDRFWISYAYLAAWNDKRRLSAALEK
ncbi:MAG: hypothetical protein K2O18_05580 [Oscillospiraceae bacterium]|nr:hypothetical protein [Oscillospiraceae bacterium]